MNIAISSCRGQMSHLLIEAVLHDKAFNLVNVFSRATSPSIGQPVNPQLPFKVSTPSADALSNVDVLIDFSHPAWTEHLLPLCESSNTKMVIGTTGFSEDTLAKIENFSHKISCVLSPNMSVGMNLVYSMLIKTMELLSYDFSIGLCERHHRGKKDSPSGTMKEMLSIIGEMEKKRSLLFEKDTSVMRIGEIVGEHKASFYGTGEYVEISHIVHNRKVFAIGALKAALFLQQNDVGMFNMRDVLI